MSSLKFRFKEIDETGNFLQEINHNDLMSEKYKKTCKYLNYIEHLHILALTVTINFCICWYYQFCSRNRNFCNLCRN